MPRKNQTNDFRKVDLDSIKTPSFTDYQLDLFRIPFDLDVMVLKSRQIGFTYVAAWCSLWLAIKEGTQSDSSFCITQSGSSDEKIHFWICQKIHECRDERSTKCHVFTSKKS